MALFGLELVKYGFKRFEAMRLKPEAKRLDHSLSWALHSFYSAYLAVQSAGFCCFINLISIE